MAKKEKQPKPEAQLAGAMNRLADAIEKFQDPIRWQKIMSDAVSMVPAMGEQVASLRSRLATPVTGLPPLTNPPIAVIVALTPEERTEMVTKINEAIQPQLAEFGGFVKEALTEMPEPRLKAVYEQVKAGKTPKLKRRHDCVFLEAGETETYLRL